MLQNIYDTGFDVQINRDASGRDSFNSIFGDRYTAVRKPKFSYNFNYGLNRKRNYVTETNGGTISNDVNLVTLQTGTNSAGVARFQSFESLRYAPGRDAEMMFTAIFTSGVTNSYQRIGLFDDYDGFWVGYQGNKFGVGVRKSGVDIFVERANFNVDKIDGSSETGFVYDPTKMNIFRINYGYLGIAPAFFQIYTGSKTGWITFHIHDVVNKQAYTHINKPYLPARVEVINSGNTTNIKFQCGSIYAGVIDGSGDFVPSSREYTYKTIKTGLTSATNGLLLIFNNKETFQGTPNKIEDLLLKIGLSTDGTKNVNVSMYRLASVPTGTNFVDIDTEASNTAISTTGTINLIDAKLLDSWELGKVDAQNIDVSRLNFLLIPNTYTALVYTTTAGTDMSMVLRWSEQF